MPIIYQIVNEQFVDKVFIGVTKSYKQRISLFNDDIKKGTLSNYKIQRDYNKGATFKFVVLEEIEDSMEATRVAKDYIKNLTPYYNLRREHRTILPKIPMNLKMFKSYSD